MHIADGMLSTEVCAVTGAISLGAVGYSLHRLRDSLADKTIPLTGMLAALIFAGQMVNFPLPGAPVSGHLMGGVLAAAVLGPWAGCIAVTLVLLVQCALFADGGVTALGANVLHMAVVGSMGGYAVMAGMRSMIKGPRGAVAAAIVAAWLSVMAAAALFCAEFFLSWNGTEQNFEFAGIFTWMVMYHSLIGIGEALITGIALGFILMHRPDLIYTPERPVNVAGHLGRAVAGGMVCALAVGAFLSPLASEFPDGLEAVAEKTRFLDLAWSRPLVFDDYDSIPVPLADWQKWSVSLAGIGGCMAVFVMALALGRTLTPRAKLVEATRE